MDGDAGVRVLLVAEGEAANRAGAVLEQTGRVHSVATVEAALASLESVDCVVSEYTLPDGDGIALLRAVRERANDLPFVLFTDGGSEAVASAAIAAGVSDYVPTGDGEGYASLAASVREVTTTGGDGGDDDRTGERFQSLIERSSDVVSVVDPEGRYEYVSPSVEHVLGHDPEAMVGDDVLGYVHEEDRERVAAAFSSLLADPGAMPLLRYRFQRGDGSYAVVESNGRNLLDDPAVGGVVVNSRDVTERHEQARTLARYEHILETIPGGVFVVDVEGTITEANQAALDVFALEREEIIGRDARALVEQGRIEETVVERYRDAVERLQNTDDSRERFEVRVTVPDGEERTLAVVVRERPGEGFTGVIGVVTDVTERERTRRRLAAERDRFATLFEEVADPVVEYVYVDGEPIVEAVNPAFVETFGYDEATLVGESVNDYIVPDGATETAVEIDEQSQAGNSVRTEVQRRTASGPRDFIVHNATIETEGVVRGYAIYTDITEQRARERVVERLHGATRDLLDAGSREEVARRTTDAIEGILGYPLNAVRYLQPDGETLAVSAVTERTVDELGDRPTYTTSDDPDAPVVRAFRSGEPVVVDDTSTIEDGHDRPVQSAMYFPIGRFGTLSIGDERPGAIDESDVQLAEILTANVEATLRRLEREEELHHRETQLERENDRLDEFASVVSHDLRNPLSVAKGHLGIARQTDDVETSLDTVDRALDRMDELIEDALTLAREGRAVGDLEAVDLGTVVAEAWAMTGEESGGAAAIEYDDLGTVRADPDRLQRLLENLFRNSVEHAGPDVTVRVRATADGFAVEDDGPGIPAEHRDRVFEAGYSTGEDGTGLGLNIARTIARAHGWDVDLVEGDSGGARFEFSGVDRNEYADY